VRRTPRAAGHARAISPIRSHDASFEPSSTKIASRSKSAFSATARSRSASRGRLAAFD